MEIRAVVFDFGGVLCFHPSDELMADAAQACGLAVPDFVRAFWANRVAYDAGRIDARAYWRDIAHQTGREFDDDLIEEMIRREVGFWNNYDQRVIAWVRELRGQGIRTGMLSNLPGPLGEHLLSTAEFIKTFDHLTLSYQLKVVKPDRAIYLDMIRGLGIERPQEALFLDDRPENVEGARAAGLGAELFTTWEEFIKTTPERYGLPIPVP